MLNLLSNAVKFTEHGEVVLTVTREPAAATARGAHVRRARHRHRPLGRRHEPAVPVVLAGGLVDDAQVRRHRPRPCHQQAPGGADGRAHVGRKATGRARARRSCSPSTRRSPSCRRPASAISSACSPSSQGKRVLVVDDNATNRRVLALQAGEVGHGRRARPSRPPKRCAGSTASEPSTLAILDMHMPEMDGVALAAQDARAPARACRSCCSARSAGARPATTRVCSPPTSRSRSASRSCSIRWSDCSRATRRPRRRRPPAKRSSTPSMAARHPLRILLAEDNVVNQKLALRLLAADGLSRRPRVERHRGRRIGASGRPTTWC